MNNLELKDLALAEACTVVKPAQGQAALVKALGDKLGRDGLAHVLTRTGWYRLGGVVDRYYQRITDNLACWAEVESGGDIDALMSKFTGKGYFATRWQGQTHYIVASIGDRPEAYLQIEIEEIQEVIDRILVDRDWYPDSLEEFVDPLEIPRLEAEAISPPRSVRRAVPIDAFLDDLDATQPKTKRLRRFYSDWAASSAVQSGAACCQQWVLALRESPEAVGGRRFSAKPVPTANVKPGDFGKPEGLVGSVLANWLHRVDHSVGYPFAWYFLMLASQVVPVSVGEQVYHDLRYGFDYLAERDARLIEHWAKNPYTL